MLLLRQTWSFVWKYLVLISILLTLLASFIIFTNLGLKFVLAIAPHFFGLSITQAKIDGSVYQGFTIQDIKIESKSYIISSDQLQLVWQTTKQKEPNYWLQAQRVDLGNIVYFKKTKADPSAPMKMPTHLQLPFNFKINEINVSGISVQGIDASIVSGGTFHLSYRNNLYTLEIQRLVIFASFNQGLLVLQDTNPFGLTGHIDSCDLYAHEACHGFIKVNGSLPYPKLTMVIKNKDIDISGHIDLSLYNPIVMRKIVSVNMVGTINPKKLMPHWVNADLSFNLVANLQKQDHQKIMVGNVDIKNANPAYSDGQGIPIKRMILDFSILKDGWLKLSKGTFAMMNGGSIDATGTLSPEGVIEIVSNIHLALADLINQPLKNIYTGTATLTGTYLSPIVNIEVHSSWHALQAECEMRVKEKILLLKRFILSKQDSYLSGRGVFDIQDKIKVDLDFMGKNFNPRTINPNFPKGSINGTTHILGNTKERLHVKTAINNSQIFDHPFFAEGFANFNNKRLIATDFMLKLGANYLAIKGNIHKPQDKIKIDINMPDLSRFGFGISGKALAKGYVQGTFNHLIVRLIGQLEQIKLPSLLALDFLTFDINISPDITSPLKVDIKGHNLMLKNFSINNINSLITGTRESHIGNVKFNLKLPGHQTFVGRYRAHGNLTDHLWIGVIDELNISGMMNVLLKNPMTIQAGLHSFKTGDADIAILGGLMHLNYLTWDKDKGLKTKGQVAQIHLDQLKHFVSWPFEYNVTVKGSWDINYNNNASGYIKLTKQSGDIIFSSKRIALGLEKLDFNAQLLSNKIKAFVETKTRFVSGTTQLTILQTFGDQLKTAPIQGQVNLVSNNLATLKYLLPIGIELKGTLNSIINIAGTVNNPYLEGHLNGKDIEYHDLSKKIFLRSGRLDSRLVGKQWLLDRLHFQHKDGEILLTGVAGVTNHIYGIDLDVSFNRYLLMNQAHRQLTISGQTKVRLDEESGVKLTGNVRLDQGKYEQLQDDKPQLSDDVYIIGQKKPTYTRTIPLILDVGIDLNNRLRFSLNDLDCLVGGKLRLKIAPKEAFKVFGKAIAVQGKYRAYGQNLRIERGSLVFTGDPTNAVINVRARRYQSSVGAGVDIAGSLKDPRITLISDIPMNDKDKLFWLVLGRDFQGEKDYEALALAAGMMATDRINRESGMLFDNIAFSASQRRNINTGELNPAQQIVTFGKQLNNNLYMDYEFGIQNSRQAVRFIYMLGRSLSIFGRMSNESNSGGIKYKIRFD